MSLSIKLGVFVIERALHKQSFLLSASKFDQDHFCLLYVGTKYLIIKALKI